MAKENVPRRLQLVRGDEVLGTIDVRPKEPDSPWFSGAFEPLEPFEAVRHLFDHELQLIRDNTTDDADQWEDWEAVHAELHEPGLRLRTADESYVVEDILVHIDGRDAWWRTD